MYAQVVKEWKGGRIVKVYKREVSHHSLDQVLEFISGLKNVGKTVNTSYIERFNLTLRNCLCALVRRTLATTRLKEELEGHIFLFQVFYHFIRPHTSLTLGKGRGKQKRTPAIATGLADHIIFILGIFRETKHDRLREAETWFHRTYRDVEPYE
jgi:hypothetical protein